MKSFMHLTFERQTKANLEQKFYICHYIWLLSNVSFDILAAERLAASFNLIDLSCDVLFEIISFVASFICCNLKSNSLTVSRAFRFPFDFLSFSSRATRSSKVLFAFFLRWASLFFAILASFSSDDVSSFLKPTGLSDLKCIGNFTCLSMELYNFSISHCS
jgi:hypothetical protein